MPVKKWSEMTDSEKRVTLAKDVISQLKKINLMLVVELIL